MTFQRFSTAPLLCLLLAGCRAAPQQSGAPSSDLPTTTQNSETAPAKTYRVVSADELAAQGAEYAAAMKKVALAPPPTNAKIAAKPRVVLDTSRGPITLELDATAAPLHVNSFLYLTGKGFFNGTKFHRHADLAGDGTGFIIQGGDPLTKSSATEEFAGRGGPGYEIPREFNDLKHDKLTLAAARSQNPDSAGSQFYIVQGPVHFLDPNYTVFGKVVSGADAALKLSAGDVIKSVTVKK